MTWRDRITETGTFRGVTFYAEQSSTTGGRRNIVHEFPLHNKPYTEDLGRKSRHYNLTLYVIGDDYINARDRLTDALEAVGAGTLVHPWLGSLSVVVIDYTLTESTAKCGLATFSVTFAESGEIPKPQTATDTSAVTRTLSDAALKQARVDFMSEFSISDIPGFAVKQLNRYVDDLMNDIEQSLGFVNTDHQASDGIRKRIADVQNDIDSLIRKPGLFASRVASLVGAFSELSDRQTSLFDIHTRLFNSGSLSATPALYSTNIAQAVVAPRAAVSRLIQQAAVVNAIKLSATIDAEQYETKNRALAVRDDLIAQVDDVQLTASDAQYQILSDLAAAMVRDLTTRGAQLPEIRTVENRAMLPAVVIAHKIYQDAGRDADIVTRNNINHPGFVSPGVIEVLNG